MKDVARSQKSIASKKGHFIQKYCDNWKQIQILLNLSSLTAEQKMLCLKGLKALSRTDNFSFFPGVGNPIGNGTKNSEQISWIWSVSMLEQPGEFSTQSLHELANEWENEG
jgi:hypothetical protein